MIYGEINQFAKRVSEILKTNEGKKENKEETVTVNASIEKGDLVSIASNATYYNGKSVPSWVKNQNWYVSNTPFGDRVVIDKNEKGTNSICSPIHKKYLTVVRKAKVSATANTESKPAVNTCPYRVRITAECLYIRKGAGTNTAKVGSITDKGVYTIVEEKTGVGATKWGKLKSGAGWISLDYVRKI